MTLCLERKILLSGGSEQFVCELLRYDGTFGILRYVIDREYAIDGIKLRPGDITYALYWTDRPYTLYVWHVGGGGALYYFNIADRVTLRAETFTWRDLVVDVLVREDGSVHILDEDELPRGLDSALAAYIADALEGVTVNYRTVMYEADSLLSSYLSREA